MGTTSVKHFALIASMALLAACGGGGAPEGAPSPADKYNGGVVGGDGGDGDTAGDSENGVIKIGSGTGDAFAQGALSVTYDQLEAGDSTTVTANLVDGNNAAISEAITVAFSSDCYANGLASFDQTSVPTVAGRASAVYTAEGCSGGDEITATATVGDKTISARVEVTTEADEVLSVQFKGAESHQLALAGMGGNETTRMSFQLVGAQGVPIRNETVSFSLNNTVGGVRLAEGKDSAVTDNSGIVTTVLQSGTVSTNVRVTATHDATGKSGVSENITVSTGVPVDSHFSVTVSQYNPASALGKDGVELSIAIIASDQYGNDALDGTQISFWSPESGNVDSSCTLLSGECSVTWKSSDPRPLDGRLTLIAYTSGAEDFRDINGNNVYDGTDQAAWDVQRFDLSEPCIDEDESGACDVGEFFVDENENGTRDNADGLWNGPCLSGADSSAVCPSKDSVVIAKTRTIVMPTHSARLLELGDFPAPESTIDVVGPLYTLSGLIIADSNTYADHLGSNPMPAGTEISFSVEEGEIIGTSSWTVPSNTTSPTGPYYVTLKPGEPGEMGILTLKTDVAGDVTEYRWYLNYPDAEQP